MESSNIFELSNIKLGNIIIIFIFFAISTILL